MGRKEDNIRKAQAIIHDKKQIRNICAGAVGAAFKSGAGKKAMERERKYEPISQYLASEILAASRGDMASSAISKKEEIERVSGSAR